jgi:hypothetical protein
MARIRSVHPGLFTDEHYAVLSLAGRELLKGLWTESDDQGVFEWKPVSIKMRIFPLDTVDVPALLSELEKHWIMKFEVDGRAYGACRNFCKYQRPQKPKHVHPLPVEHHAFVRLGYKSRGAEQDAAEQGGSGTSPVSEENEYGTDKRKPGQMEEGGGKRKRNGSSEPDGFEAFYQAYPKHEGRGKAKAAYVAALKKTDAATLLQAAQAFRRKQEGENPKYIPLPASWLSAERWTDEGLLHGPPDDTADIDDWRIRQRVFRESGRWSDNWGPRPGTEGCKCPRELMEIAA